MGIARRCCELATFIPRCQLVPIVSEQEEWVVYCQVVADRYKDAKLLALAD